MSILIYMDDTGVREDGYIYKFNQSSWANARDATSGTTQDTGASSVNGIRDARVSARGGGYAYHVYRSFFQFDVSSVTTRPNACKLKIYGLTNTAGRVNCVKAKAADNLDATDFDAIEGWVHGADNYSNVTYYASELGSWEIITYNKFTFNDTALDDMHAYQTLQICLLGRGDLRNFSPTADNSSGLHFSETFDPTKVPVLEYQPSTDSVFFGANF